MVKRTILTAVLISSFLGFSYTAKAQETRQHNNHTPHSHDHADNSSNHEAVDHHKKAKLVTGQGEFIFSWDKELTAALPKEAHEFEPEMHGGFNEDPETGIV